MTTQWIAAEQKPNRRGWYQVQTESERCDCCWCDAYFEEGAFWQFGVFAGRMRVRREVKATRWRVADKPQETAHDH